MSRKSNRLLLASLTSLIGTALAVHDRAVGEMPIGTAFTYQGELESGDTPVDNLCNFQFSLWDDPVDASPMAQVGMTISQTVDVVEGRLTTVLDFNENIFTGSGARWLQIAVCCPSPCGAYTTLNPRQELTPAPYALALPGLYTQEAVSAPNIIGGFSENNVELGMAGATISGGGLAGEPNLVADLWGTISGGADNTAGSNDADINTAQFATVGGGRFNAASANYSTVSGGKSNSVTAEYGAIAGGDDNTAGAWAAIGGGQVNIASGSNASIGGGGGNDSTSTFSTIAGGWENTASGFSSAVGGGELNAASASHSAVPGGLSNTAAGNYSMAAGRRAKANHDGAFVWADSTDANFNSTAADQYLIRATGGVGIGTTTPTEALDVAGNLHASGTIASGNSIVIDGTAHTISSSSDLILVAAVVTSNCCSSHAGTGCDDFTCETAVCAVEGLCCSIGWEFPCDVIADSLCDDLCQIKGVGIGTTTPSAKLDVVGTTELNGDVSVFGAVTVGGDGFDNFDVFGASLFVNELTSEVGIGTVFPGARLGVLGTTRLSGTVTVTPGNNVTVDTNTLFVDATGNAVGIGTNAPSDPLTVAGVVRSTTGGFELPDGTIIDAAADLSGNEHSLDAADGSPVNVVFVDNDGEVGIGATNPSAKLDVVGTTELNGDVALNGAVIIANNNSLTVDTNTLFVDATNGEVGIGTTSPSAKLNVVGTTELNGAVTIAANNNLTVDTNTLFVDATGGEVGIGTTTPSDTLDVVGSMQVDGNTFNVDDFNDRVGIGTPTPSFTLDVAGSMQVDSSTFNIDAVNHEVGIGTAAPDTRLHVVDSIDLAASPANHVALVENSSTGTSTDMLAIQTQTSDTTPSSAVNFITFFRGTSSLGAIEGNGSGSVVLSGAGSDYAEYLAKFDSQELFEAGDVVGVQGGRITKDTSRATGVMVISSGPIVAGNQPQDEAELVNYERVAFVGQAPVRVLGQVQLGDLIVPSGDNDGVGLAVPPSELTPDLAAHVVGMAWESSDDAGVKKLNTLVGISSAQGFAHVLQRQQAELEAMRAERDTAIEDLRAEMGTLKRQLADLAGGR